MFLDVAGFELRYQLRQPVFWVVAIIFILMTYLSVASPDFHIGGDNSNIHRNAPFAIALTILVLSLFFMFVTTAFVANVVVRDEETGFAPIIATTRITRFDYILGRFTGAYLATALAFAFVPLGVWLGALSPWLDPETLGPNPPSYYLVPYLVLGLPSLFVTGTVFFFVASVTRSMVGAYVGVVAFLVVWTVMNIALGQKPELRHVMALADPFGISAFRNAARYWTASDRNLLTPPLTGELLWNRAIWIALGAGLLGATYAQFRFGSRAPRPRKQHRLADIAPAATPAPELTALPRPVFDARAARAQLWARTRLDMGQVFKSPIFFILIALGVFNSLGALLLSGDVYGTPIRLTSRYAIQVLEGSFTLIPLVIAIFYSGELVWRDRDRRLHEIIDATAVPDWAFVAPKVIAIALVLVATLLVSVATAAIIQLGKGGTSVEMGQYLFWYVAPQTINAMLLAALAVFVQTVSPHKFVGSAILVTLIILAPIALSRLGLEDHLYIYADWPNAPLSDMNGQGKFWQARAWFQAYWSAFALMLLVLAYGLWRRGSETRLAPRLARLPHRLAGPAGAIMGLGLVAFIGLGIWIFVNTHVWNDYRTQKADDRRLADYEKTLLRFADLPQPTVTDVALDVDLHPHTPEASTRGRYVLENRTRAPLSEVHVRVDLDSRLVRAGLTGARLVKSYPEFHYYIYRFDRPLAPGQRAALVFETWRGQHGFANNGYGRRIVDNGTFLNNFEIAPAIGMTPDELLSDRSKRREFGLTPELRLPKLGDPRAKAHNYLNDAAWVNADIKITTDADQTPIAPGYKVSDTVVGGRRTAEFRTDAPVLNFFSVQSARYAEKHVPYKGIDLAVYYDAKHAWNIDRIIASAKAGLDDYQARFGPYQFRQFRTIEFPAYAEFAQSFANTVPWSEDLGFLADLRDPDKIDYVTYVGDHELAHQWWGHQIIGAREQGETVLSETLAQYSALMVMRRLYGPDKIRRFLKAELDSYLRARGAEGIEELPLERVENQPYIHYHKGALVMYLLQDQIGEARVDAALRRVLERHAFQGPPYPTARELASSIRLETPIDQQTLIDDLFGKITLYDVKATAVRATKRPDGRWAVRLMAEAAKLYADGKGKETEAPMIGESFDVGLFSARPGDAPFGRKDVILFERRPLHSGRQSFDFVTDKRPTWAGIDPYAKRIDRNADDNLIAVE
jgi:aminopeptidase N